MWTICLCGSNISKEIQPFLLKPLPGADSALSLPTKISIMFNKRIKVKELLAMEPQGQEVTVMGWVRTFRNNQFIALNDGSTNNNIQVVVELGSYDDEFLKRITTSASLKVTGTIIPSLGKGQKMDLKATSIEILGDSDAEKYPLQPKKHSLEFLREKECSEMVIAEVTGRQ